MRALFGGSTSKIIVDVLYCEKKSLYERRRIKARATAKAVGVLQALESALVVVVVEIVEVVVTVVVVVFVEAAVELLVLFEISDGLSVDDLVVGSSLINS